MIKKEYVCVRCNTEIKDEQPISRIIDGKIKTDGLNYKNSKLDWLLVLNIVNAVPSLLITGLLLWLFLWW